MKFKLIIMAASFGLLTSLFSGAACGQDERGRVKLQREVAVTVDDLPSTHASPEVMQRVTTKLLESFRRHKVPAIGFVNERKLYVNDKLDAQRVALLKMWLDAGYELGNHTYSHVYIDEVPLEAYKENVIRGETVTKKLLAERGRKLEYFRHTQLRTGPTPEYKKGLEAFLAERGYTVAPVTIDNNEFIFADVYAKARARGDRELMKRIGEEYLRYMEEIFAFFEKLSADSLGYEVKQTLLLHANELNADYFDDLALMMKRRGYKFVTLRDALKDPAYKLPDALSRKGLSWLHRWMIAKGAEMKPEPSEPEFIKKLFKPNQR